METNIIEINIDDLQISLMDGSVWMLANAGDIPKVSIWYPPQRIEIEENDGEFILCNLDTYGSEKIRVSRIA